MVRSFRYYVNRKIRKIFIIHAYAYETGGGGGAGGLRNNFPQKLFALYAYESTNTFQLSPKWAPPITPNSKMAKCGNIINRLTFTNLTFFGLKQGFKPVECCGMLLIVFLSYEVWQKSVFYNLGKLLFWYGTWTEVLRTILFLRKCNDSRDHIKKFA